ncbi:hypothetical protein DCC78_05030 [bacterium]|nr:MAG: hypothetical protein DCC78_05030 [bacterium]
MNDQPVVPLMPVLADEGLPGEFVRAIREIGPRWTAPSGRVFDIAVEGTRAVISIVLEAPEAPPSEDEIDLELLELIGAVHDAVGEEWSSRAVQNTARAWGWEVSGTPS